MVQEDGRALWHTNVSNVGHAWPLFRHPFHPRVASFHNPHVASQCCLRAETSATRGPCGGNLFTHAWPHTANVFQPRVGDTLHTQATGTSRWGICSRPFALRPVSLLRPAAAAWRAQRAATHLGIGAFTSRWRAKSLEHPARKAMCHLVGTIGRQPSGTGELVCCLQCQPRSCVR